MIKLFQKNKIIPKNKLFKMDEIVTICLNCQTTTRKKIQRCRSTSSLSLNFFARILMKNWNKNNNFGMKV